MARGALREREQDVERTSARVEPRRATPARQPAPPPVTHRDGHEAAAGPAPRHDAGRIPLRADRISAPDEAAERQADAVAGRAVRSAEHAAPVTPPPAVTPPTGTGTAPPALPRAVTRVLAAPPAGRPLPSSVRTRVEPHVAGDLGAVRVLTGPQASAATAAVRARAFTVGSTIVLGHGQSVHDTRLMAHETAHVAAGAASGGLDAHRSTIMRDILDALPALPSVGVEDLIPDAVLDAVRHGVRSIPGYTLLTQIIGVDPLTNTPVHVDWQAALDELLAYGPFGAAVGAALKAMNVLDSVATIVTDSLARYGLTLARITADLDAAWKRLSVTGGIDGNLAVIGGFVDGILADVRRFVADLVERILAVVREAAVGLVEPLLTGDGALGPVWSLATKVFHHDPLREMDVEATTVDILADFLHLVGQDGALQQMRERGTLDQTAVWLDEQLATFLVLLEQAKALFSEAWAAIQPQNLASLPETLPGLARRGLELVAGIGTFAGTVLLKVLELVKKSLLGMLTEHAYAIPGFRMISVVIGKNPFTDEPVPRTAANLIGGFVSLLPGGEAIYEQLAETGVIADAAGRIESAMTGLGITPELVTTTFLGLWDALHLDDLLTPLDTFERVVALFGDQVSRIVRFVSVVVQVVVELVLRLMHFPSDLLASIISQTLQAIEDIRRDPVGFLKNMLLALKTGLLGFFERIGGYLVDGLVAWLLRGVAKLGITIPKELTFASVLGLVLDVLGLSMDFLWRKLGEHLGQEKVDKLRSAMNTLGGVWQFVKDVQERGIVAIWEYVQSQLSNLWQTILTTATTWITETFVKRGLAKLATFLDPTGIMAVVNSCIAFFEAVKSAIEYVRDILQIVNAYVSTFAAIARGDVAPGAAMIEKGLADAIPVAIGFLAPQVGLGDVPEQIAKIIKSIRSLVEKAVDWLVTQAIKLGKAALDGLGLGRKKPDAADTAGGNDTRLADVKADRVVPMLGKTHHLSASFRNGKLVVELASVQDILIRKIDIALQAPAVQANSAMVTELNVIRKKLAGQEKELYDAHFGAGQVKGQELSGRQFQAAVQADVDEFVDVIARQLQILGEDFDIDDLKESPYVLGGRIRPEYKIRKTFYGEVAGKPALRKTFQGQLLKAKQARLSHWTAVAPVLAADGMTYECPGWDYKSPHLTREYPIEIEHRDEVVTHWNTLGPGRGQTQDQRRTWNNSPGNLSGMCGTCNGLKETLRQQVEEAGYNREILPGFEGPPLSTGKVK